MKWLQKKLTFIKFIKFSKRQQFVGVTLLLTTGMMATQWITGGLQIEVVLTLALTTYILSALVLREQLSGWEFVTLMILPTFYTIAVYTFYFLLPTRWLTRLPIAMLYAIGMYAILLTENIYNVAAERNIQLLRAAHSVGFLLTLVTVFFLMDTLLSLHLPFFLNGLIAAAIAFPLTLQALWSMELTSVISPKAWVGSFIVGLILGELTLLFSFWPIRITIEALFLTTVFYSVVGTMQQYLVERLFTKTVREFLAVLSLVFILVLLTTRWGQGTL